MKWTPALKAEVTELWLVKGMSATEIAAHLQGDATRSAVIGLVHRLGLDRAKPIDQQPVARVAAPRAPKPQKPTDSHPWRSAPPMAAAAAAPGAAAAVAEPAPTPAAPPVLSSTPLRAAGPRSVDLLRLRDTHCKFPAGPDGGESQLFCGEAADPGHAYCARHRRLCRRAA